MLFVQINVRFFLKKIVIGYIFQKIVYFSKAILGTALAMTIKND